MFLGLDIGYSNLISVSGKAGVDPKVVVKPATAAPENHLAQGFGAAESDSQYVKVLMGDDMWVAGADPRKLSGWSRQLHPDYPSTDLYKALFKSALALSDTDHIETLVTGLPCNQIADTEKRESLVASLKGTHKIAKNAEVTVEDVAIVPQPAGAYVNAKVGASEDQREALSEGRVIVFDPGFFSVDWCEIVGGDLVKDSVGSSLKAMSRVLEYTCNMLRDDYGVAPEVSAIESAVRIGSDQILLRGKKVEFSKYLASAAEMAASESLTELRQQYREKSLAFDAIVMAGGGGSLYKDSLAKLLPGIPVVEPKNSVTSNAEGFWVMAGGLGS